MGRFGRRKPLHERLAEQGGLAFATTNEPVRAPAAQPPGWNGEPSGEPGVHGVPRPRKWDVVTTVDIATLQSDALEFVALPDSILIRTDDERDEDVETLAQAVDERLAPPYRAEAVRQGPERWAVGASAIKIAKVRGLYGSEANLVVGGEGHMLTIDGELSFGSSPALERVGEAVGAEYVVRAKRLQGDIWEVDASPL